VGTLALAMGLIASACGGGGGDPEGRTWMLTELGGAPALPGTLVTLTFFDGSISGTGGCNDFAVPAAWSDGDFIVESVVASTRRACETAVMSQEELFFRTLTQATRYEVDGDLLALRIDGSTGAQFSAEAP
jgi:heat shock protein HslJ